MLVFKAALILSVALLIQGQEGRNKDKNNGKKGASRIAKDIRQVKEIVPDLAIDTITESSDIAMSDLKALVQTVKESKGAITPKAEAVDTRNEEIEEEEAALKISISDAMEQAQYDLVNAVCKAAKHARGDKDVILGKILGATQEEKETKRSVTERKGKGKGKKERKERKDCLEDNPMRDEIESVLQNCEKQIADHYLVIIGKKLDKIEDIIQASENSQVKIDKEEILDIEIMREAANLRVKSSMERLGQISCSLIKAAKSVDSLNEKEQAEVLERANDIIAKEDKRGKEELQKTMEKVKKSANKAVKQIKRIVNKEDV